MNTYNELLEYLLSKRSSRYSLYEFDQFITAIDFRFTCPTIHVTATNGKGSIVNYLRTIYTKSGYRVASFMSPTSTLEEMISINGMNIEKDAINEIFWKHYNQFVKYNLSEFEILTFIAFYYFMDQDVQLCILEVGMGGLIDATNIVQSTILSIIGRVGMEHGDFLGRTVSEIAKAKAGIIKESIPVLSIRQDESAEFAIKESARHKEAELLFARQSHSIQREKLGYSFSFLHFKDLFVNSRAFYQIENACVAIEATLILRDKFPVCETDLRESLREESLDGRYTTLPEFPRIIIDGAHNPDAIQGLVEALSQRGEEVDCVLFAAFKDKNVEKMLSYLGTNHSNILLTTYNNPRARDENDYFLFADDHKFVADYKSVISKYATSEPNGPSLVVCGSLDFAYHVIAYLGGLK